MFKIVHNLSYFLSDISVEQTPTWSYKITVLRISHMSVLMHKSIL